MSKTSFNPLPGWTIVEPYIAKDETFVSAKESSGDAQRSKVIAVGEDYIDDHGNLRQAKVKVGDVILHIYNTNGYEIAFTKYRAVHFSQIISILK